MKKKIVRRGKRRSNKSSVLKKTFSFLDLLYNRGIPKPLRLKILDKTNGDIDLLNSTKEIAYNVKNGNLKLQKGGSKHDAYIDEISNTTPKACKHSGRSKKCKTCKKQSITLKRGDGFLAIAIPALASLAGSYLASR